MTLIASAALIAYAFLTLPRGFEGCVAGTPYESDVDQATTMAILGTLLSLVAGLVALPKGPPGWDSAMRTLGTLGVGGVLAGIFVFFSAGGIASC